MTAFRMSLSRRFLLSSSILAAVPVFVRGALAETDHAAADNEFALTAKPLSLEQCAAQDREERAKWADYVRIARIERQ